MGVIPTERVGPEGRKRMVDGAELHRIVFKDHISSYPIDVITVEQVWAMPNQGSSSGFNFGKATGIILGVCQSYLTGPLIQEVKPNVWKRYFGLILSEQDKEGLSPSQVKSLSKSKSRLAAIERWPEVKSDLRLVKDADKADALWIAEWGRLNVR